MRTVKNIALLFLFFCLVGLVFAKAYAKPPKVHTKPPITDEELTRRLQASEGGIIIADTAYFLKKGIKPKNLPKFENLEEMINQVMDKKGSAGGELYIFTPESGNKEKRVMLEKGHNFFLILGKAGEYVITRYMIPSPNYQYTESYRIFGTVQMEEGKLKYAGELVMLAYGWRDSSWQMDSRFDPKSFIESFKKNYPHSSQFILAEPWRLEP